MNKETFPKGNNIESPTSVITSEIPNMSDEKLRSLEKSLKILLRSIQSEQYKREKSALVKSIYEKNINKRYDEEYGKHFIEYGISEEIVERYLKIMWPKNKEELFEKTKLFLKYISPFCFDGSDIEDIFNDSIEKTDKLDRAEVSKTYFAMCRESGKQQKDIEKDSEIYRYFDNEIAPYISQREEYLLQA